MVDTFFGVHLDAFKPGPIAAVVSADAFLELTPGHVANMVRSELGKKGKFECCIVN